MAMTTRAMVICAALGIFAGCQRPSEEQRAQAALEGRNLRGSSPRSLDDRIPEITGDEIGPQPGFLEGAFAYASFEARVVRTAWTSLPMPSRWVELALLLDGVDPSARISVSMLELGSGVHVRAYVPTADHDWRERATASGLSVRADGSAYVVDWFDLRDDEPNRSTLIEGAIGSSGARVLPELERLQGDAVVLIDGPRMAEAVGADPALREVERLFSGITVELSITDDRLLARARWLSTAAGSLRLREVFELDLVDADVPTIAALCDGALICARSRGLPARDRFASLATGPYTDRHAVARMLRDPAAAIVLALETWPNAIGGLLRVPDDDVLQQNAMEIGARVLGFGFSTRSDRSIHEDWIAYARMTGADLDAIRLLLEVTGHRPPTGSFHGLFDPGNAWGFAVLADGDEQLPWFTALPHDDGAVPLLYAEIPDLTQLIEIKPNLLRFSPYGNPPAGSLRAQLTLGPNWSPELRLALVDSD
jgi:hypothetical protein